MKIKNLKQLSETPARKAALAVAEAGLAAIDTKRVVQNSIQLEGDNLVVQEKVFPLAGVGGVFFVGIGKCSLDAARALEDILGEKIKDGIVVDVREGPPLKKIRQWQGDHPLPSERNVDATKQIIKLLGGLSERDLVIVVVSGGGSTLLCQPHNFTCQDESELTACLSRGGATIQEINTVRKHISLARGGYLAKHAHPARVISLIFSDIADGLEFVSSGPTIKDTTTVEDAIEVFEKYELSKKCSLSDENLIETPKDDAYFTKVSNILLLSNKMALEAMSRKAKELGFTARIVTDRLSGEAREVGEEITKEVNSAKNDEVFLYGGETTVTVIGEGKGGRCQELALSALRFIKEDKVIVAFASDGRDNTDFAGAISDVITKKKAEAQRLDINRYLASNNSHEFFKLTEQYLMTGPTGSNVSDLIVALGAA